MACAARWMRLAPRAAFDFRVACGALAELQSFDAPPLLLWAPCEERYAFALLAPRRLAPGRASRWGAWGLSPAVAAYRDLGLHAYLDGDDLWLHGSRLASGEVAAVGCCVVVASSFVMPLQAGVSAGDVQEFRAWLSECIGIAPSQWPRDGAAPAERVLEAVFRQRITAQHGWQFEHAWPDAEECAAMARAELSYAF